MGAAMGLRSPGGSGGGASAGGLTMIPVVLWFVIIAVRLLSRLDADDDSEITFGDWRSHRIAPPRRGAFFAKDCLSSGLGCAAWGKQCCRFRGVGDFATIECTELVAKALAKAADELANEKLGGHSASVSIYSLGTFFSMDC